MPRIEVVALCAFVAAAGTACSEKRPTSPDTSREAPSGMIVSNAGSAFGGTNSLVSGHARAARAAGIAYVSAVPGTFPGAASVTLANQTGGGTARTIVVTDGGFDPVAIEAAADDELYVTVLHQGGESAPMVARVPLRRSPTVIRTQPSSGRLGVALTVQTVVVFSEPIDSSSLTSASLTLIQDDNVVKGRVQRSADGLSATFIADNPLQPLTEYELLADVTIRDRDGDRLNNATHVSFTTWSAPPPTPAGQGSISGQVLDSETGKPLMDVAWLQIFATSTFSPVENVLLRPYDRSTGSFSSQLLATGTWKLEFRARHAWTFVFPGLPVYVDTALTIEVAANTHTVIPDLLLRPRPPLLLVGISTCPWFIPDPPALEDWWDCDSGYWGGADVRIKVTGVAGTPTEDARFDAVIGPARYSRPADSWNDTPWSAFFDIAVPGEYDVTLAHVGPAYPAGSWHLVPWQTPVTRVTVGQGVSFVEFDFYRR